MYFTDKDTNRKAHSLSGIDFEGFAAAQEKINQSYDEVYISAFSFDEEYYYAEHNDKLCDDDLESIRNTMIKKLTEVSAQ